MTDKPVDGYRLAMAFVLTPALWYLSYMREATNEPLLGGAGIAFYSVGVVWLLLLTLIAWGASRLARVQAMGLLILVFCLFAGVIFSLLPDAKWSDSKLPWYLKLPILSNAFLFHLTTGLIFVLLSGLRLRPLPLPPRSANATAGTTQ